MVPVPETTSFTEFCLGFSLAPGTQPPNPGGLQPPAPLQPSSQPPQQSTLGRERPSPDLSLVTDTLKKDIAHFATSLDEKWERKFKLLVEQVSSQVSQQPQQSQPVEQSTREEDVVIQGNILFTSLSSLQCCLKPPYSLLTSVSDSSLDSSMIEEDDYQPQPLSFEDTTYNMQGPPIPASSFDAGDSVSVISGTEQSRVDKWNMVTSAVKSFLPEMQPSQPSPVKGKYHHHWGIYILSSLVSLLHYLLLISGRRIPDRSDPKQKPQPTRFPLHPTVSDACEQIVTELRQSMSEGKGFVTIKPDRSAPPRFFKPEGFPGLGDACTLESQFK